MDFHFKFERWIFFGKIFLSSYGSFISIFYPKYLLQKEFTGLDPEDHVLVALAYKPIEIASRYYNVPIEEVYQAVINEEIVDALVRTETNKDIHFWKAYREEICPIFLHPNVEIWKIIQNEWVKEMLEL